MTPTNMEENPVRRRILHFVGQNPGSTLQGIGGSLGINESTLRYHLKCLEREGDAEVRTLSGRRLVYPGSGSSHGKIGGEEERKLDIGSRRVLSLIRGDPGIELMDILERTDISKKDVRMVLRGLIRSRRIVMVEDREREKCSYYLTGTYYDSMFRYLVELLLKREIDEDTFLERKAELDRICQRG